MMLFQSSAPVAERIHALMARAPEHERPPWLAVADEGCTYAILLQGEGAFDVPIGAPAILRVGDDLHTSRGVAAFDCESLKRFLRRARAAVIVSSEATLEAYSTAAAAAAVARHDVVLVASGLRDAEFPPSSSDIAKLPTVALHSQLTPEAGRRRRPQGVVTHDRLSARALPRHPRGRPGDRRARDAGPRGPRGQDRDGGGACH